MINTPETRNQNLGTSSRPPVVTVMGHVDHGKSTLLDYIRKTNIVDKEVGGITQKLSAYEVKHKNEKDEEKKITFLDTPGHEAFRKMRSNSTAAADIAILVVSAEDGVKEQTREAYKAAKDASIPVIVAISKIDKPNANVERVKASLAENEIHIEGWGGEIPCVEISSKSGVGVPELLDMILLVADVHELTGNAEKNAEGIVIEASVDPKAGTSATLLIKDGTLEPGMFAVSGESIAPIRAILNYLGKRIDTASCSSPVRISGWNIPPATGSEFVTFKTKKEALDSSMPPSLPRGGARRAEGSESEEGVKIVPIIIKADALGAMDAIHHEIEKIKIPTLLVKIVSSGVGTITENDIKVASPKSGAIVLGFNVKIEAGAKEMAERFGVRVMLFDIIYKLGEWLAVELERQRPRVQEEEKKGALRILKVFSSTKSSHIAGGKVLEGVLGQGDTVKIMRRDFEIGQGEITELQEQKTRTKEVAEGHECGFKIATKHEIAPGDMIEAFKMVEK
ncbi:translation initiation factor IF-2 [bacterium]|nr:translation initiation factor IF-2 [bacterium]